MDAVHIGRPKLSAKPGGNAGSMPITSVQRVLTDPMALVDATVLFTGPVEVPQLFDAARAVCERHEALRTTLHPAEAKQVIHEYSPELVRTEHLVAPLGALFDVLAEAAQQPLDPATLPVFRCVVVTDGGDQTAVHFGAPHTVSDRASLQVVTRDFLAFLRSSIIAEPVSLPPVLAQYADHVRWRAALCTHQQTWSPQGIGTLALSYWSEKLAGATTPAFGRSQTGPDRLERMTFLRDTIGKELTAKLLSLCQAARSSTFQLVLAAFEEAVARQTGNEDVTTLCMVHGRGRPELRETVGLLTEEVAFRHVVRADSRRDYLASLTRDVLMTYAYQDIPLAALIERSTQVSRYYSLLRFRSMYLHFRPLAIGDGLNPGIPGVAVSFPRSHGSWPAFLLPGGALFSVDQNEDHLEVELMYDARVWPEVAMQRLIGGFADTCRAFAYQPDEPLHTESN